MGELSATATIQRSYASGSATAGGFVGLCADTSAATLADNHFNQDANAGLQAFGAGSTGSLTVSGISPQTEAALRQQATFAGWDFDTIWSINEDLSYPFHQGAQDPGFCARETLLATAPFVSSLSVTPNGTTIPYPICTAEQFAAIVANNTLWSFNFVLMGDIDFSTLGAPPDTSGLVFNGVFDGNHRTMANLEIETTGYSSLFGRLDPSAVVRNLTLRDFTIAGAEFVGTLAGENYGLIEHVTGINLKTTGNAHWSRGIGGLVGRNHGTISDTNVSVHVVAGPDGSNPGGLVGRQNAGLVTNCTESGSVVRYEGPGGSGATEPQNPSQTAPTLVTPVGGATASATPTYEWQDQADALAWQLWISTNGSQTSATAISTLTANCDSLTCTLTHPTGWPSLSDGTHNWWVRACVDENCIGVNVSPWSPPGQFTVNGGGL